MSPYDAILILIFGFKYRLELNWTHRGRRYWPVVCKQYNWLLTPHSLLTLTPPPPAAVRQAVGQSPVYVPPAPRVPIRSTPDNSTGVQVRGSCAALQSPVRENVHRDRWQCVSCYYSVVGPFTSTFRDRIVVVKRKNTVKMDKRVQQIRYIAYSYRNNVLA